MTQTSEISSLLRLKEKVVTAAKSLLSAVESSDPDNNGFTQVVNRRHRSKNATNSRDYSDNASLVNTRPHAVSTSPCVPSQATAVPQVPTMSTGISTQARTTQTNGSQQANVPPSTYAHPRTGHSTPNPTPKVAIIGTSLVRGLGRRLVKRGLDVTCFMYPGAEIPMIQERVCSILNNDYQPDIVVLQCGGNDVQNRRHPAEVIQQMDNVIQEVKRCCNNAKVVVNSIPPRGHNNELLKTIFMVNTYITNMSKQRDQRVYCSDACPKMFRYFQKDEIHLNHPGKQFYANELYKVLINFCRDLSRVKR